MKHHPGVESLRAMSKIAFGQTHRLELMLAIRGADDGLCCLSDLALVLNVPLSSLQRPFDALIELDLIRAIPSGDSKNKFYIQTPSPAWDWAESLASGLAPIG